MASPGTGPLSVEGDMKAWAKLSYIVYMKLVADSANENLFLSVPQLLSQLAFLSQVINPLPAESIRRELISERRLSGCATNAARNKMLDQLVIEQLNRWEQYLDESLGRQGIYCRARRMLIKAHHSKAFSHATFQALDSLGVEASVVIDKIEPLRWIQISLPDANVKESPLELWQRDGDDRDNHSRHHHSVVGRKRKSTADQVNLTYGCPILIWISHLQIAFECGLLDTEALYRLETNQDSIVFMRFSSERGMKYAKIGQLEILELPCSNSNFCTYILQNEKSTSYDILMEAIEQLKIVLNFNLNNFLNQTSGDIRTAYIPRWEGMNPVTNIAKAIKGCMDIGTIFTDSIGDIGMDKAVASSEIDDKNTSTMQMLDIVTTMHTSAHMIMRPMSMDLSATIITFPFAIIIFDVKERMPVYFGRIVHQRPQVRRKTESSEKQRSCTML